MQNIDIKIINQIARDAGAAIMEIYESNDLEVEVKTDSKGTESPLTKADKASHELIVARLRENFPDILIVSEEQDAQLNQKAMQSGRCWVVDPIDGTKGFINRDGEFTVNIGFVENGEPTIGVVYIPALDELYYTDVDGAKMEKNGETSTIHASNATVVKRVVASKNHLDEITEAFIQQFDDVEFVQAGSSIKICRIATGDAEVYPRLGPTTMEWDTAAADAVLRRAGGIMIDMEGQPLKYGKLPELRNFGFVAAAPNVKFTIDPI